MEDLKQFIQDEVRNLAFVSVGFDDALITSKLLDSITVVDLIVSIEDKTGKQIPQHLIKEENFDTINLICDTLKNLE